MRCWFAFFCHLAAERSLKTARNRRVALEALSVVTRVSMSSSILILARERSHASSCVVGHRVKGVLLFCFVFASNRLAALSLESIVILLY